MKLIILFTLLALAFAQDDVDYGGGVEDVILEESVIADGEWPQNDDTNAGVMVKFAYAGIEDGSCTVELPGPVNLFHVMNGHIVTGDQTNPIEGRYKISAPAGWEAVNGTLNVLIIFQRDEIFNITEITFTCDPSDVAELSVYSFPQNNLQKEASSNVFYRPGFHEGDVLTITLPTAVDRFNITGGDSELVVDSAGENVYTVTGFKNEDGVDDMKEVHFSIDYVPKSDEDDAGDNWFAAGDVTVSVTRDETVEEEGEP